MAIKVYTSSNTPIDLVDTPLASAGGEGTVYRVKPTLRFPDHCAKIFHKEKITDYRKLKIAFMVENKPPILSEAHFMICWPTELVYRNNNFVGFIMPMAFGGSEKLYELTTTKISNKLPQSWHSKFSRTNQQGILNRLKICVNIAGAVNLIHRSGKYSIIDFKPQNILINVEGNISIIDVDSFQISNEGNILFHSEVATPEYTPPEAVRLNPSQCFIPESWDRFSLAICFYEILFGIHPYTASCDGQYSNATTIGEKIQKGLFVHGSKKTWISVLPPIHNNFNALPNDIKQLFIKAFEDGHTNHSVRPTAEKWGLEFFNAVHSKNITPNKISPPNKVTFQPVAPNPPITEKIPKVQSTPRPQPAYRYTSSTEKTDREFVAKLLFVLVVIIVLIILYSLANNRKY